MSCLSPTGLSTQAHVLGLSCTLSPPAKLLSVGLSYKSTKWIVVVGLTGVPLVNKTKPPLTEFETQSPTPLTGVLASRSPSMAKPPDGGLTGAVAALAVMVQAQQVRTVRARSPL